MNLCFLLFFMLLFFVHKQCSVATSNLPIGLAVCAGLMKV